MVVSLGSNVQSLRAQRSLNDTTATLGRTFERLSSGLRINRASDDAAGLAIASTLNSNTRVFTQAIRNVNDGVSYLNIAQGALGELSSITTRQLELAEQSANGSYSYRQRKALNTEATALANEFNRIVQSTEFNGRKILDVIQNGGDVRIQAGYGVRGGIALNLGQELSRVVGTGELSDPTQFTSHTGDASTYTATTAVQLGDVNGDGILDMISAGYTTDGGAQFGETEILLGDGKGNFSLAATLTSNFGSSSASTSSIKLGDVNGDGTLDIVSGGSADGEGQTRVFLNDGKGKFSLATTLNSGSAGGISSIQLGDMNGDGALDLVSGGYTGQTKVFLGDGKGSFSMSASVAANPSGTNSIHLGDVNGDGFLDVAAGGNAAGQGQTRIFLGDGKGHLTLASSLLSNSGSSSAGTASIQLGDVNGDGILDLVSGGITDNGSKSYGQTTVSLGDGKGNFTLATTLTSNNGVGMVGNFGSTRSIQLSDMNGDGILDLVAGGIHSFSSSPRGETNIFIGDGKGNFTLSANVTSAYGGFSFTYAIQVGDLDGDGAMDVASGGSRYAAPYDAGQISFMFGTGRRISTISQLDIDLLSQSSSRTALTNLNKQLTRISNELGTIGSFQSRLGTALGSITTTNENYSAASARIQDADIAGESLALTRLQILQQSASAVLAQANQQPALTLSLLRG